MSLPPPPALGLPSRFSSWREGQNEAIWKLAESPHRISALVLPTGAGKSAIYMGYHKLLNCRTLILTSTKSLQTQLLEDFKKAGLYDVRGQSNYPCSIDPPNTVDMGPCHSGIACDLRSAGCTYFDALKTARNSRLVCTNYSLWLSQTLYGEGLGKFDLLICDEGHAAPDELLDFLAVTISDSEVPESLSGCTPPSENWSGWARTQEECIGLELDRRPAATDRAGAKRIRHYKDLRRRLLRLMDANESEWVLERGRHGWRFDPISARGYAEKYLFQGIPRIVMVSATIRPKTLSLLGIESNGFDLHEGPSAFPILRRPVVHVPTVRLTHRIDPASLRLWLSRIDSIIRGRLDRKGIIHTVSYARRDYILNNSRYSGYFISHDNEPGAQARAVKKFKAAQAPAIFISPSAMTGLDFPYNDCEYQIIAKIPFPDTRSLVTKARTKEDPDYGLYVAMVEIVQAAGRGMRAPDDQCEVFIIDDLWLWLKGHYKRYAPSWFLAACRTERVIPAPPPAL